MPRRAKKSRVMRTNFVATLMRRPARAAAAQSKSSRTATAMWQRAMRRSSGW